MFLDTQIKSHACDDGLYQLQFSVYYKPIGSYQYIHRRSCHPISCMKSIAYAEALRRLKLSTLESDYAKSLDDLRVKLMRRGYKLLTINEQLVKVPFSDRKITMQGTLDKFERKRNPSFNSNPMKREREEEISEIIPIICRYDPRVVNALKSIKTRLQDELRSSLIAKPPFANIRLILAWKKNITMVNQIMRCKKPLNGRKRPFLSNPEMD